MSIVPVNNAVLKSAELQPLKLRLGNGLGGKLFFTFTGDVAAVETILSKVQKVEKE